MKKWVKIIPLSLCVGALCLSLLSPTLANAKAEENGIPQQLVTLGKIVEDFKNKVLGLQKSFDNQQQAITSLNEKVSSQQTEINELKNHVSVLQTQVDALIYQSQPHYDVNNITFTSDIQSPDLKIFSLSATKDSTGTILITMKYSSDSVRSFSFFNPPNGSSVMLKYPDQIQAVQNGEVTFKVPDNYIPMMPEITMSFYGQPNERDFIFLNPMDFGRLPVQ